MPPAKLNRVSGPDTRPGRAPRGRPPVRHAWVLLLALAGVSISAYPASAGWKLVDEGACEGPIVRLSEGMDPLPENCTQAMAGKGAVCFTEVCRPHCLYFNYPLEQCQHGADMAKRYVCVPD